MTGGDVMRPRVAPWAVAAVVSVLAAVLMPLAGDSRHFFYGDTPSAYYGWWYHLGEELRAGRWPLLDAQTWRAGNLAAEGQWGLYSPLVMVIGLLASGANGVLVVASAVKVALAVTGAMGVFAVVRSYSGHPAAAYVAAVAAPLGGMTQYLDLPSWAAGLMIWALFPWVWWALRRLIAGGSPLPALGFSYLLVTVGYVYGTIMLIWLLLACLVDCRVARDRAAALRVVLAGAIAGLVALTVYLPGVLTAAVTVREVAFGGFGGKFSTDPLAMFTSILPTASVPGTGEHLLPYAYAAWFLPVLCWVDVDRVRRDWRELAGLGFLTVATFLVVDGPARFGPLRWPLRLQPFLVQMLVVLCAVAVSRYVVRRPSSRRLAASLAWVGLAGGIALVRAPSVWVGHLASAVLVAAAVWTLWLLVRRRREGGSARALAAVAVATTLVALVLQQGFYPDPPSPERNLPETLAGYRTQLPGARGDVVVVGDTHTVLLEDPAAAADILNGSGWYLTGQPVQNTYTAISHRKYYDRYCMHYDGSTCPDLLRELFSVEPVTGRARIDLLSASSLLLLRDAIAETAITSPPPGWHVAAEKPRTVLWVRNRPLPSAGGPVWSSPGTRVSQVSRVSGDDREVSLRVDSVTSGGGQVVLSRLAWPGYSTDVGRIATPVDDYLLALDLPPGAAGSTVTVRFSPPGWVVETASWWLAVILGVAWSLAHALRGSRGRGTTGRSR